MPPISDEIPEPKSSSDKKLHPRSLADFFSVKTPVSTSQGTLYLRRAIVPDWKYFQSDDETELGKAAIRQLCSRIEDKQDDSPLSDEELRVLVSTDFDVLAHGIRVQNDWGKMFDGPALQGLGQAMKQEMVRERLQHEKMLEDARKSIGINYKFLDQSPLKSLQDQMVQLADRDSVGAALRTLQKSIIPDRFSDEKIDHIFNKNLYVAPPRYEDSPVGRASIESAKNLREVVEMTNELVAAVSKLQYTFVQEVFPAWRNEIKAGEAQAKNTFKQAEIAARWAVGAIFISALITLGATWWQVTSSENIDQENTKQMKAIETILREQFVVQNKLVEQQDLEASQMRKLLEKQNRDSDKFRMLLGSK